MKLQTEGINPAYLPLIQEGIQTLQSHFSIIGVLLFGSLARNEEKPFEDAISDVDIIVVVNKLPSVRKRLQFIRTLIIDPRISIFLLPPEEIKMRMTSTGWLMDALSHGKILFDPQKMLTALITLFQEKLKKKHIVETPLYWDRPVKFGDEIEL